MSSGFLLVDLLRFSDLLMFRKAAYCMCEFNIQEIELFNYRQFEDKKFALNSRMNVFAGKNSSGKTTVLEAANVVLGAYLAAFKTYVPSRFVFNIKSTDARRKTQFSANIITRIKRDNYISPDTIEKICKTLDCGVDDILEFTTEIEQ